MKSRFVGYLLLNKINLPSKLKHSNKADLEFIQKWPIILQYFHSAAELNDFCAEWSWEFHFIGVPFHRSSNTLRILNKECVFYFVLLFPLLVRGRAIIKFLNKSQISFIILKRSKGEDQFRNFWEWKCMGRECVK